MWWFILDLALVLKVYECIFLWERNERFWSSIYINCCDCSCMSVIFELLSVVVPSGWEVAVRELRIIYFGFFVVEFFHLSHCRIIL